MLSDMRTKLAEVARSSVQYLHNNVAWNNDYIRPMTVNSTVTADLQID